MATLDKDDLAILREAFDRYDTDGSGFLSCQEFVLFLTKLGKHVDELRGVEMFKIKAVFALIDTDFDGKIEFTEFCQWWLNDSENRYSFFHGRKSELLYKAHELYQSFASNGGMSYVQFNNLLEQLDIPHTEYDFDALDKNEDGMLSFPEFCEWLNWF